MNKAAKTWMTIAIVSMVVSPILGIVGLFGFGFLGSQIASLARAKTYHKPAEMYPGYSIVFDDADHNVYCRTNTSAVGKLRKFDENGNLVTVDLENDSNRWLNDLCVDDDYIYITSVKAPKANEESRIVIFNKKLEKIKTIELEHGLENIEVCNGYLYCVYNSYYVLNEGIEHLGLEKYSLETFERTVLTEELENNTVFKDGDSVLFFEKPSPTSGSHDLFVVDKGEFWSLEYHAFSYHKDYGKIDLAIVKDQLRFSYQDSVSYFPNPYEKSHFYRYNYIKDNYLIFGIREELNNNECVPKATDCICRYGRSSILRFDLSTRTFIEPIEYQEHTVLVNYDFDGAYYYYDGGVYDHDTLLRECKKIEPKGKISTSSSYEYDYDWYPIVYFKGEFYGV